MFSFRYVWLWLRGAVVCGDHSAPPGAGDFLNAQKVTKDALRNYVSKDFLSRLILLSSECNTTRFRKTVLVASNLIDPAPVIAVASLRSTH